MVEKSQRQIREEKIARVRFWSAFAIITTALLIQGAIHSCSPTVPSTSVFDVWAMQQEAERRAGR